MPKVSGMKESEVKSEWLNKQQKFGNDGESNDEYLELFRNEVAPWIVEKLFWFSLKILDDGGELEESIVWLTCVDALAAPVHRCLTGQETGGGQKQKLYAATQGNMPELALDHLIGNVREFVQHW